MKTFNVAKDEMIKVMVKSEGQERLLSWRWTLFTDKGLVVHENLDEYARIHIMNTQYEIIDFLQNNRKLLLEKYHVTKIGLFGSFARNEQKDNSDVDLLIELEEGTQNIYDLKDSLKQFLSASFNRSVDIAREKYLKSYARESILKDTLYV